jgi:predicted  nucleic acid-binding Zn-ribbon protein
MSLHVQTSPGEFLDKLTILEIKSERIDDAGKLANVRRELDLLRATWRDSPLAVHDVSDLVAQLKQVNESLWDIEDRIREKEAAATFDAEFVELARAVYRTNDRRAAIKRELNLMLGSDLIEEKSYKAY